jgi:UDP-N-acetylmuramate--alanine ligase
MKRVHFIGISGSGLSAIARLLLESGYLVSGSDRTPTAIAGELEQLGATIFTGHAASNVVGADVVVRSSAIPDDNIEVIAAREKGLPVLKRAEFLGQILPQKTLIAIAGTHGKTTTTAMAAWALHQLGRDPSYIIGGVSKNLGNNAHSGHGDEFVIEADEYDRMFLGLTPDVILVTYMEHDHPDCFPTPEIYYQVFVEFIQRLTSGGLLIVNGDHIPTASLLKDAPKGCRKFSFGLSNGVNYRAANLNTLPGGGSRFDLLFSESNTCENLGQFSVNLPGLHNLRNALVVLALAHQRSLPLDLVGQALTTFSGTGRRFDLVGEANGITILDDYAHHPTEIRATMQAARARFPGRRIWAVWQPHTYSRTHSLMAEFSTAFKDADRVIVTEVYAAREVNPGFSAHSVAETMTNPEVHFSPTLGDATQTLLDQIQPGDVVIVLSAGDADCISREVFSALQMKGTNHD